MPRANRYFLPGYIWHITHRCHRKEFLLKFGRDRDRWIHWLFEAKKRYSLVVLNYVVTSNHIHLLAYDAGDKVIPASMRLIAGRAAQEYNRRKKRKGAFWEDRYHATAVCSGDYLLQCMLYIDLNMVRAGVVNHPSEWKWGGWQEIHHSKDRYRIIELENILRFLDGYDEQQFLETYDALLQQSLTKLEKVDEWSESVAIGDKEFVETIQKKIRGRTVSKKPILKEGVLTIRADQESDHGQAITIL